MEDGVVTTGPFEGAAPAAAFFAADKTCQWTLDGDTCVPVNYDSGAMPDVGGLPGAPDGAGLPGPNAGEEGEKPAGIPYATASEAEACDIYTPEGVESAPVIVLVHGGGFMFGDQGIEIIQPVIHAALDNGYAVVSVDYRKSSETVFPAALADEEATGVTYWETYADQIPSDMHAWIQAGDSDQRVPCTQSETFAERLAGYIGEENVQFSLIPGADHEDDAFYTEENLADVFAWLDGVLTVEQ